MKAESRKQIESNAHESSIYSAVSTELPNVESIIEYERYSSFERIIRITAWIQRFIMNIRRKSWSEKCVVGTLRVDELQLAKSLIIKDMQRLLLTDKNYKQWEHQLNLFTDHTGIIRCKGHLSNADLSYIVLNFLYLYQPGITLLISLLWSAMLRLVIMDYEIHYLKCAQNFG